MAFRNWCGFATMARKRPRRIEGEDGDEHDHGDEHDDGNEQDDGNEHDDYDDYDDGKEQSDSEDDIYYDIFSESDDDLDAIWMDEDTEDGPSALLVSMMVMMMCIFCCCYAVLHKVGSGNYDHSVTTTRAMRLRLPDREGHIEILGTRSYRLMNWTDVLYRSLHCDGDCLTQLLLVLTPWLLLPRCFSAGFFNPDNPVNTSVPLAEWQAIASTRNPLKRGRKAGIDPLGLIITYLQRVCTCSAFVTQAELNLVSMASVHRALEHVGWAISQALYLTIDVPINITSMKIWMQIPACIRAHFGLYVMWGALDDTLQVHNIYLYI